MKWRTFVRAHAHLIAAADFMDDPDREKPDGLRGWVPLGQAVPDPGPGRTVRAAVPGDFEGCERERVAHGIIVHRT